MNPSEQLRDIRGLDELPWWPLAPGGWLLLGLILLLIVAMALWIQWRRFRQRDWQRAAQRELSNLLQQKLETKAQLMQLGILLRRVAMQRYGRHSCANLTGERWLAWLTEHDPQGFNWLQSGQFLVKLPYQPTPLMIHEQQLQVLYQAVKVWIEFPVKKR